MKKLFLVVLLWPVLAGCKKDEEVGPAQVKRASLVKAASWIQTAATVSPAINGVTSYFMVDQFFPACSRDDLYRYAENGTYTAEEGASKCATADPDVFHQGTWRLTQDEERLLLEYVFRGANNQISEQQVVVREVVVLNDQQMQLRYRLSDNAGTVYTFTDTYQPRP
jgi:hypothetical protein